jgi:hypothetical protein
MRATKPEGMALGILERASEGTHVGNSAAPCRAASSRRAFIHGREKICRAIEESNGCPRRARASSANPLGACDEASKGSRRSAGWAGAGAQRHLSLCGQLGHPEKSVL